MGRPGGDPEHPPLITLDLFAAVAVLASPCLFFLLLLAGRDRGADGPGR